MSTLERHPLTTGEADTICAGLHLLGIDVACRIEEHLVHLYPTASVDVHGEVTALAAFITRTDTRLAWHATRSTP